jgi:hypothetical protein
LWVQTHGYKPPIPTINPYPCLWVRVLWVWVRVGFRKPIENPYPFLGYGFLWVWVRVYSNLPTGYPCPSLLAMLLHFLRNRRRWPNSNSSSSSAAAVAATSIIAAVGSELGAAARMRAVEDVRRRFEWCAGAAGLARHVVGRGGLFRIW